MNERSLKKELVDFLKKHPREIINKWADRVMEIPAFKASENVPREIHLQAMSDFFPLVLEHIKNRERQDHLQFLKELTQRGFLAGFSPSEVFKGHLALKRAIFDLLNEEYPDNGKKIGQFHSIIEEEIEGHLETIIESYHQISTAGLQESEQKYKILTDSSLTGIFIHQDDKYVFVNDRFAEMHGYKPEELLGKEHLELIHPDQREMIKQRAYKRLKGETVPQRYEIKRLRKDGKTVWHEIMVSDPINYRGRPAIMGHEIDISESKRAEEEIRRRNEELSALNAIVVSMIQSHNQDDIMDKALEKVLEITHMDGATIRLLDEERDELAMIARKGFQGFSPQYLKEMKKFKVDGSLSGQALLSGEPLVIEDLSKYKFSHLTRKSMLKEGIQSIAYFPLRSKDRVHGVLNVLGRTPRRFTPQDVQLLNSIAFQIGVAIESARLYEEAQNRRQEAEILNKINMEISSTLELKEVLRLIVENARNLLKTDMAFIAPLNEETGVARIIASLGTRTRAFDDMDIYPGRGIGGKVLLTGEHFITDDYLNDDRISHEYDAPARAEGFVGNMSIPIKFKGRTIGVLWVVTRSERHFTRQDQDIAVNLANQAAIAIENARLYQELKESEEKYRTILENIEDGYFEVDIRGNFTFFNDSMCKILAYPRDELIGMNNREYMDQENAKKVYQTFNRVYTTGEPTKGFDYEIIRKDGAKGYVESSASLIKDAEGQPIGLFRGIMRDVTARKQMETDLTQTKNFLQSILDSSIDGITTTDLQGDVIYTSPRTKDILGYKQEKIIGKEAHSFYGNGKEDAKAIMKELTEKGELRDHEMKFIRKDGELVDINLSASLLKDEKEEVIGTLGIYRDITAKNILEAQLAQAQRMESIGTLAGGMAHNFNNLLMAIQGNASIMLLDVDSSHPHYERLKSIEKGVQRGSRLTRQLLGYARGGKYEPRPISLNQLVKETSNTFGETRKEVVLHRELAEGLYGIKADQSQIEQSLLNLYVNAAEAMPDGGDLFLKTMNVTHKDMKGKPYEPKPGNYVLLTVRDTGVGMDKETKDRIFDPFFTTKGLAKSTGLGLASVYGIVKAHGGYIDVESNRGQGTTFEIYLPATQKEKEVKEEKKFSGELVKGKGTILLVDDEETIIDVGEQMLKKLGYEVYLAKGGQEAIDVYKENKDRIDMVLLDIVMPGMGGGKTYDSLREIDSDIKVLLSSGYDIEGKAKEILERGCDAFIQKPFNMRQLSEKIREILDKR